MSLSAGYDRDNIFAKIIRGEAPAVKLYEDTSTLAFLDLFPQSRGHTLVISKTSTATNILDVESDALSAVILSVQRIARALRDALNPDGVRVIQFNGAPAGQTVFHLHFHIIPVYADRNIAGHGSSAMADRAELEALAESIRTHLR